MRQYQYHPDGNAYFRSEEGTYADLAANADIDAGFAVPRPVPPAVGLVYVPGSGTVGSDGQSVVYASPSADVGVEEALSRVPALLAAQFARRRLADPGLASPSWPKGHSPQMVTNYAALKAEVGLDPAGLGYAGKPPAAVADLLNAVNFTRQGVVATGPLRKWAAGGPRAKLEAASSNANPVVASMALTALDILHDPAGSLDLSDPAVAAMVQAVAAAGVLSSDDVTSLTALARVPASRAQVLWGPAAQPNAIDVEIATTQI